MTSAWHFGGMSCSRGMKEACGSPVTWSCGDGRSSVRALRVLLVCCWHRFLYSTDSCAFNGTAFCTSVLLHQGRPGPVWAAERRQTVETIYSKKADCCLGLDWEANSASDFPWTARWSENKRENQRWGHRVKLNKERSSPTAAAHSNCKHSPLPGVFCTQQLGAVRGVISAFGKNWAWASLKWENTSQGKINNSSVDAHQTLHLERPKMESIKPLLALQFCCSREAVNWETFSIFFISLAIKKSCHRWFRCTSPLPWLPM